jgi:hypothetical protein
MGEHEDVFGSISEIKKRGEPYWWLWLGRCRACNQAWLVAQEERQNDLFCMLRLSRVQSVAITDENRWPTDFDTYEALLGMGLKAGFHVRFVDPLGSSSLPWTIEDLARDRPGIRVSEIARLLRLDQALAFQLAERVVRQAGVSITFD